MVWSSGCDKSLYRGVLPWLREIGWMRVNRTIEQRLHRHEGVYELHYLTRAKQIYRIGDRVVEVPPHAVMLIPPGLEHGPADGRLRAGEMWWMGLDIDHPAFGIELATADREHIRSDIRLAARAHVIRVGPDFATLCRSLVASHQRPGVHDRQTAHGFASLLLSELCMAMVDLKDPDPASLSGPVARAVEHMRRHLDRGERIAELAALCGLSERSFHERFQRETGYTPANFWNTLRIEWAKEALTTTDRHITDLALAAGFASSQYFATVFRRAVGCTPQQWRIRTRG